MDQVLPLCGAARFFIESLMSYDVIHRSQSVCSGGEA